MVQRPLIHLTTCVGVRVSIPSHTQQGGLAQSCQPQQDANDCLLAQRGRGCESVLCDSRGTAESRAAAPERPPSQA